MEATPSYSFRWDPARNLIEINYRGRVGVTDVRAVAERVEDALQQASKGFTLLVDLTGLDSMELDCAVDIARIMDACNAAGIGTVARVIPDRKKDIGLNILSIIHYRRGVHVLTFDDLVEARSLI
jgi:anti-anti-sigma regulatory factor